MEVLKPGPSVFYTGDHSPPPTSSFYFSACVWFLALKPQILINRRFEQGCLVINTVFKKKEKKKAEACLQWLIANSAPSVSRRKMELMMKLEMEADDGRRWEM